MDFNEARRIITESGNFRIFRLSGESSWRCIYSEISADHMRDMRSGQQQRIYADDIFLDTFCNDAGLIARPVNDELIIIPFESLSIFSASILESATIIWTDSEEPIPEPPPRTVARSITPHAYLDSLSFDFTVDLRLPCGSRAPPVTKKWQYSLATKQLSAGQQNFSDAIAQSFLHPSSIVKPIGHRYVRNILATLRKLWGICMNHLGFTESQTRSLRILDPAIIAYYFRFLAHATDGRNSTLSTIELERQGLKHLVAAMKTQVINNDLGLREEDLSDSTAMTIDLVSYFIDNHVRRAIKWVPHKGARKEQRLDLQCVPNSNVIRWKARVEGEANDLMQSWGLHTRKTEALAMKIQDIFVGGLLGALFPPQRSEVLQTLVIAPAHDVRPPCSVPGCQRPCCKGNYVRILPHDASDDIDYEQYVPQYSITVGHAKNTRRGENRGETVHLPEALGPAVQFLLHQMATWSIIVPCYGKCMHPFPTKGDSWSVTLMGVCSLRPWKTKRIKSASHSTCRA